MKYFYYLLLLILSALFSPQYAYAYKNITVIDAERKCMEGNQQACVVVQAHSSLGGYKDVRYLEAEKQCLYYSNQQACNYIQGFALKSQGNSMQNLEGGNVPNYGAPTRQESHRSSCESLSNQRVETQNDILIYDGCGRLIQRTPKIGKSGSTILDNNLVK